MTGCCDWSGTNSERKNAMSMALRANTQRHVTGLFVRSRKWNSPLSAASMPFKRAYPMSSGYQRPGR